MEFSSVQGCSGSSAHAAMPGSRAPFLRAVPLVLVFGRGGRRFVECPLGMDVADEVNVLGQVGEHALAAVGAIAGDDEDLVVGEPGRRQFDEFDGQFRAGAMVGRSALGFLALAWPFFPFVSPWRLR